MPQARYFVVTQTRQVKIRTDTLLNAAKLATVVFNGESITTSVPEIDGWVMSQIEEIKLNVENDQ